MPLDVVDLARFYASPLGRAAEAMIARRLSTLWTDVSGLDVLAVGYAARWLEPFRGSARRTLAAMPAAQGVERWPALGLASAALVEETALPFREAVFDRVLVAHVLEETESLRPLLRELWRVTAPEARLVFVAPNRIGWWARAEASPFGHGRAFSRTQLMTTLRQAMFEPTAAARALYVPPLRWPWLSKGAEAWERTGEKLWPAFGGVILVEAVKRVVAETPRGRRRLVFAPAAQPMRRDGVEPSDA